MILLRQGMKDVKLGKKRVKLDDTMCKAEFALYTSMSIFYVTIHRTNIV